MQAKSSEVNSPQQANSLAHRIRWVLTHFRLEQNELAEVMGVKVDRVKTLVLGRAKNLRREELARLISRLQLREDWLVDGVGEPLVNGGGSAAPGAAEALASYRGRQPGDSELLVECVRATEAVLAERGLQMNQQRKLRLYWAVFELSLPAGKVNRSALEPLLALAAAPA